MTRNIFFFLLKPSWMLVSTTSQYNIVPVPESFQVNMYISYTCLKKRSDDKAVRRKYVRNKIISCKIYYQISVHFTFRNKFAYMRETRGKKEKAWVSRRRARNNIRQEKWQRFQLLLLVVSLITHCSYGILIRSHIPWQETVSIWKSCSCFLKYVTKSCHLLFSLYKEV